MSSLKPIERLRDDEWARTPPRLRHLYQTRLEAAWAENERRPSLHRDRWSRLDGTNPRARGTNPRATGANPRANSARSWLKAKEAEIAACPHCDDGWVITDTGEAVRCPAHDWGPPRT